MLSLPFRMTCLAAICLTQAWMMWKFINFQLKKWREHSQNQALKKKTVSPKSKPHKREPTKGEYGGTSSSVFSLYVTGFMCFEHFVSSFHLEVLPTGLWSSRIERHHGREKPKPSRDGAAEKYFALTTWESVFTQLQSLSTALPNQHSENFHNCPFWGQNSFLKQLGVTVSLVSRRTGRRQGCAGSDALTGLDFTLQSVLLCVKLRSLIWVL